MPESEPRSVEEEIKPRMVRGDLVLKVTGVPLKAAQVVVQVEDYSRADAPSTVVGQQRQLSVPLPQSGRIPFEVAVPAQQIDELRSYSVRAHVDFNGSGTIERGDLITTQTYPVLTHDQSNHVEIEVRPV